MCVCVCLNKPREEAEEYCSNMRICEFFTAGPHTNVHIARVS